MADFGFTRMHAHPYASPGNATHAHFKPTPLHYPPYGAAALPFRWMMKKFVFGDPEENFAGFVERFPLQDVNVAYEPSKETLGFKKETNWLQDHRNHRTLLDCFWNHVRPDESLVFFYAKQVPLIEDTGRRVIIGVGRVKSIGNLTEYEYNSAPGDRLRSLLWERMVVHSIRPDFSDGFLMPYHQALEKSDDGRAFDPADVVAFAPDESFDEFSYATEHVGHDAAISALHASCLDRLRSSRLNALAEKMRTTALARGESVPLDRCTPSQWFELVASVDTHHALCVLRLAGAYRSVCTGQEWGQTARMLSVIPTNSGELASAGKVVLVPPGATPPAGRQAVASSLVAIPEAKKLLSDVFGIGELDEATWRAVLKESLPSYPRGFPAFLRLTRVIA